jgi:preprotein translocase subunit SecD
LLGLSCGWGCGSRTIEAARTTEKPLSVRLSLEPAAASERSVEAKLDQSLAVLRRRLATFGLPENVVRREGKRLELSLPEGTSVARILPTLTRRGTVELRHLRNVVTSKQPKARYRLSELRKKGRDVYEFRGRLSRRIVPEAEVLAGASLIFRESSLLPIAESLLNPAGKPWVKLRLDPAGTTRLAAFSRDHLEALLAFVVDGRMHSAPMIDAPLMDGVIQLEGQFKDIAEARSLAVAINSGPLPLALRQAK